MIEINFEFPDWAEKLKAAEAELNLFMAAQIQFNRGMIFDQEGAWNGRPRWKELAFRRGQILSKRGTLRKSIAPFNPNGQPGPDGVVRFAGDEITIGTKLFYAALMNYGTEQMPGGVMRPVKAKALKIPVESGDTKGAKQGEDGKYFIFRKWVRIPARPFNDWTQQDQDELDAATLNKVKEVLNR